MEQDNGRGRGRHSLALQEQVYGAVAGQGQRGAKRSDLLTAFGWSSPTQVGRAIAALEDAGRVRQYAMTLADAELWGEPWKRNQYIVTLLEKI